MPDMVRLASMDGVYSFSLDAGAFGATIKGKPVIKNLQAVDEPAGTSIKHYFDVLLLKIGLFAHPLKDQQLELHRNIPKKCVELFYRISGVWQEPLTQLDLANYIKLYQFQIPTQESFSMG